jgi:hypothetical protein
LSKDEGQESYFHQGITPMAKYNHLGPATARHILSVAGALERDLHQLSGDQVSRLLSYADEYSYLRLNNVAVARGRSWHSYLLRRANQAETRGVAT